MCGIIRYDKIPTGFGRFAAAVCHPLSHVAAVGSTQLYGTGALYFCTLDLSGGSTKDHQDGRVFYRSDAAGGDKCGGIRQEVPEPRSTTGGCDQCASGTTYPRRRWCVADEGFHAEHQERYTITRFFFRFCERMSLPRV